MSANNVVAVIKREVTFGVAPSAASARQFRTLDSPGLELSRTPIESMERRTDLLETIGRLGSKSVSGSFNSEVNPGGDFDWLLEDAVRGTLGAVASVPSISAGTRVGLAATPATPVFRSYAIEQRDIFADESELHLGCRLVQTKMSLQPNEMSRFEYTFQGVDRTLLGTGASPFYTTPSLTTGAPLIADDAVITYAGSPITTLTGLELTLISDFGTRPTIGSFISPDVYMNKLRIAAEISVIRANYLALTDFDAETEFAIQVVLSAPGSSPKLTFAVNLPRVKIMGIGAQFSGGDDAKIETRRIRIFPPNGASDAVRFYTSTETPVAV